jgi:hypothetical protein
MQSWHWGMIVSCLRACTSNPVRAQLVAEHDPAGVVSRLIDQALYPAAIF